MIFKYLERNNLDDAPRIPEQVIDKLPTRHKSVSQVIQKQFLEKAESFYQFNGVSTTTHRVSILIFTIYKYLPYFNEKTLKEIFLILEGFYVRRILQNVGLSEVDVRYLNGVLNFHGKLLSQKPEPLNPEEQASFLTELVVTLLDEKVVAKNKKWYHNSEIEKPILTVSTKKYSSYYRQLFIKIEESLSASNKYTTLKAHSDYQLEHFMPQEGATETTWPLVEELEEVRQNKKYALGNLVLLTPKENNILSNRSFKEKRAQLIEWWGDGPAPLVILDQIYSKVKEPGATWNEKDIDERTKELFKVIFYKVYPDLALEKDSSGKVVGYRWVTE